MKHLTLLMRIVNSKVNYVKVRLLTFRDMISVNLKRILNCKKYFPDIKESTDLSVAEKVAGFDGILPIVVKKNFLEHRFTTA